MKFFFTFTLFTVISTSSIAQFSIHKEKNKYWIYRERLKNFMVFGKGTSCKGCDIIADKRDKKEDGAPFESRLSWNDSPWFIGYWIGTLAMEYQLLTNSGLSSTSPEVMQTKEDLYGAIQSINRLDWEAEESWGCSNCIDPDEPEHIYFPCPGNINGFLIVDDVPSDFSQAQDIIDGLNEGLVPPRDEYRDKCISSAFTVFETPGREASMDHLIGLYIGLALVYRCVYTGENWNNTPFTNASSEPQTSSFLTEVQIISKRIVQYLANSNTILPWTYQNPCMYRCVIGIHNDRVNSTLCGIPNPDIDCSWVGTGDPDQCCAAGGALAMPEAIGFAAVNKYIQGNANDPIFESVISNSLFRIAWNQALNNGSRLPITLAALGNIWKVGICMKEVVLGHICLPPFTTPLCPGLCICTACCELDEDIVVKVPSLCGSSTAQVSDHLVNAGISNNNYWEHLYLLHKLLYGDGGSSVEISNVHYECLLNAAPCRGWDGTGDNVEWSWNDRLIGDRNAGHDPNSTSYPRVDYMFYFNLYHLSEHPYDYSYAPIPVKHLALENVVKPDAPLTNYTEYDKKNFIAANTINANNYEITFESTEGQGRVTFAAGQKIILGDGFKVTGGGYFHGYIDTDIQTMNCTEPSIADTDCSAQFKKSGPSEPDTITDTDSLIFDSGAICALDSFQLLPGADTSSSVTYYWDFGNGNTSTLRNPFIYYTQPGNYIITLLLTDTQGNTDTVGTEIYISDCEDDGFSPSARKSGNPIPEKVDKNSLSNFYENKLEFSIVPNPSVNGIFNVLSNARVDSYSDLKIKVTNLLGEEINFQKSEFRFPLSIDISKQSKGFYFVQISNGEEMRVQKIIYQ